MLIVVMLNAVAQARPKNYPGSNTPAYFNLFSVTKEFGYVILTPGSRITKLYGVRLKMERLRSKLVRLVIVSRFH
jgi:hypothetical protein